MIRLNGFRLQQVRISRQMTQAQLAEHGDTSERYIRKLESGGKCNPSAVILYRIARALEIPMEELMESREEEG